MQFDFHLSANGGQTIDVAGRFFKYKSGTGAIRVKTTLGGYVDLLPGQGVWNVDYVSLTVQDMSGAANSGTILAGNFDFHDDRIAGTVDIIDGGRSRTIANQAFLGYQYVGPSPGNYSAIQIWNPAGSGKNIYIEQVQGLYFGATTAAQGLALRSSAAALTTLVGNTALSKKSGGAASVAEIRTQQNAAPMGTATLLVLDKTLKVFKFTEPYLIQPGTGLILHNFVVNEELGFGFEFFEEPN